MPRGPWVTETGAVAVRRVAGCLGLAGAGSAGTGEETAAAGASSGTNWPWIGIKRGQVRCPACGAGSGVDVMGRWGDVLDALEVGLERRLCHFLHDLSHDRRAMNSY